ncbi:MAG: NAD-dependent epimerase/dehydratase family protein [Pirellulaceae bacterium]
MRALVTGAGGFLGEYLVEQLVARGDSVRGMGRHDYPRLRSLGVELVRGDIRDASVVSDACRGMDVVYHVAAVAGIWGPWEYFHGINTRGTAHVLAACRQHSVRRLVYTSSPSVTFDGEDQEDCDETAPYPNRWLCHYPHTKMLAERDVLAANDQDGLLTCSLRPHLIWGPRDQHLIPRLLDRARQGRLMQVGDGTNWMDAVYVENAARAHVQAADRLEPGSPVCGRAYFITNGEPVNCWEWIRQILARAGLPPLRRKISFRTAWRLGHFLELVWRAMRRQDEPRMTRFLAAQLAKSHYFNIRAARRDLEYTPLVTMAEGMERLAGWLDESPVHRPT